MRSKFTKLLLILIMSIASFLGCKSNSPQSLTDSEKELIQKQIKNEINKLILAVSTKDIESYMAGMPDDFVIYDESGDVISREKQKEYALRDWSIIDTTLNNEMHIDSIDFVAADSIFVYTSQRWERLMFQRDGITKDSVITTQLHKELWKNRNGKWIGYDVLELGGKIFINGKEYIPE